MTYKALKERFTLGTVVNHTHYEYERETKGMVIDKVQKNGVFFDDNGKRFWLPWPKASEVAIDEHGFTRFVDGEKWSRYDIVQ